MTTTPINELKSPSVQRIVSTLEENIRTGSYQDSHWLPTERALAEQFHVSRAVVRAAVSELERRHLVIRGTGCRPLVRQAGDANAGAGGSLRRSLGLWITNEHPNSGAHMTARGVQSAMDVARYRLVLACPVGETQEATLQSEAEALTRMAEDGDIAGLILWYNGGIANLPALQRLRAANIPLVFVDRLPPAEFDADYVGVDNRTAAQEIVEHLLAQGHRTIAHITNSEPVSAVYDRLEGYRAALEAAKRPFRPELVFFGEVQGVVGDDPGADELAERLLRLPDRPTAVFAVNDYLALALVTALQARGVRIPDDIAIAGFDDLERWSPRKPFLTTVRQPFERIGREAARLLQHRIKSGSTRTYRHLLLDSPLIVRESTRASA